MLQSVGKEWYVRRNTFQASPPPSKGGQREMQWPSLSDLPGSVPGSLRYQPRANQQSDEAIPRGCSPAAGSQDPWAQETQRKQRQADRVEEWLLPHKHTCDYTGKSFLTPLVSSRWSFVGILSLFLTNIQTFIHAFNKYGPRFTGLQASCLGFPGSSVVNNPSAMQEMEGSIPVLGRSPGEGNGNPLQYFCLENSMNRGAWWVTVHGVTKSRTWQST